MDHGWEPYYDLMEGVNGWEHYYGLMEGVNGSWMGALLWPDGRSEWM